LTSLTKQDVNRLHQLLAELGGGATRDDDIVHEGTRYVLPAGTTVRAGIKFLKDYEARMEEPHNFSRTFRARPWDGAAAVERGLKKIFGHAGVPKAQYTFFGKQPPELRTINIGVDEVLQVPWGLLEIPSLQAEMYLGNSGDPEYGVLFAVQITAPRKFRAEVEGLFQVIQDELQENSIYRGKAIDGKENPDFLDLRDVDPKRIVYSEEVFQQFEANIWSLLRHSQAHRDEGLPLKRAVLLYGDYGTGKTEGAKLTARYATENGWGFIMCRPGRDDLEQVFQTARLLQPCVVFFEDVDTLINPERTDIDTVARVLDLFDGLTAKGTELIAVLTTNHPEKLQRAMFRPGRLDAVIKIGMLDKPGVEKLVKIIVGDQLHDEIDWDAVFEAYKEFTPSWIVEACGRARRYSMVENDGDIGVIDTQALISAATGLQNQLELMRGALDEKTAPPTLDKSLSDVVQSTAEEVVQKAIDQTVVQRGGEHFGELVVENGH
jgi:hypothetical protein